MSFHVWVYFWALYFVPLMYMSDFVPIPYYFDYCSFVVLLSEGREGYASSFVLFPRIALEILGLLWLKINFRIISVLQKNIMSNLMGTTLNLQIALDNMAILTILILPVPRAWDIVRSLRSSSVSSHSVYSSSICLLLPWSGLFLGCVLFFDEILTGFFFFYFLMFHCQCREKRSWFLYI